MAQNAKMNIALYKALLDAGIKEKHAIAAATEAANNVMSVNRSLAKLDSDIKELRSDMEKSISDVERSMERSRAKLTNRLASRMIFAMIGAIGISMTFTYFMMDQLIRLLGN